METKGAVATRNAEVPALISQAATSVGVDLGAVNLLMPSRTYGEIIGEYERLTIEVVSINPDKKGGDVYSPGGSGLALSKVALQRIGVALAIEWDPIHTGVVESTSRKARAKATGALRKPNGEWVPHTEEKTIDVDAYADECRQNAEEEAEKGKRAGWDEAENRPRYLAWANEAEKKAHVEKAVRTFDIQMRKFKDERALTGAIERVIKFFVALKSTYTSAELSKPFAIPRVVIDVSKMMANPDMRDAAMDRALGSSAALFGNRQAPARQERVVSPVLDDEAPAIENPEAQEPTRPRPAALPQREEEPGQQSFFDDEDPAGELGEGESEELTPIRKLQLSLMDYLNDDDYPIKDPAGRQAISKAANDPAATEEDLGKLIERTKSYRRRTYGLEA